MGLDSRGPLTNANQEIGAPDRRSQEGASNEGWHSRGYLPHFESEAAVQHVTFHLADSLPASVVLKIQRALMSLPAERRDVEKRKRLEAWMDAGHGSCVLERMEIAEMVESGLLYFEEERYRLMAWVVMPNHVHALFQVNRWMACSEDRGWMEEIYGARDL